MRSLHDCIREAEKRIIGSYSACMIHEDKLIAFRDPYGIRPLILGQISKNGENYPVIASETCALEAIGAEMVREIVPGEIVMISAQGIESYMPGNSSHNLCAFELVYFSRPDSILGGMAVDEARENMGRVLAKEWPATADYVIAIPDSGNDAALGYHEESGIPFKFGFVRNRYIGRTFIDPEEKLREFLVQMKLSPIKHRLKGKRLVVVDDSIVRGTTSKKIVRTLKEDVGVKEVHLRIASPPKKFPCPLGEDTPEKKKLIAGEKDIEAIRQYVGCESLGYLSMEGLLKAIGRDQKCNYCVGCFSGKYPMPIERIPPKTEGEE